jgi:hypothetical protein
VPHDDSKKRRSSVSGNYHQKQKTQVYCGKKMKVAETTKPELAYLPTDAFYASTIIFKIWFE